MPQGLTVITSIKRVRGDEEQRLRGLLEDMGRNLRNNSQIRFDQMRTVHYAAWLILPSLDGEPARLLLETNYDETLETHLNDLIDRGAAALDDIYNFCEGYPGGARQAGGRTQVLRYFLDNQVPSSAYYVALPGRSLEDIRNAICVYQEAKDFLGSVGISATKDDISARLIEHFRSVPAPKRPLHFPVTQRTIKWRLAFNLALPTVLYALLLGVCLYFSLMVLAVVLLLLPVLYPLILCLVARYYEMREERSPRPSDPTEHPEEYRYLNVGPQNHLCTLSTVKAGCFRRFVLWQALLLGRVLATRIFILGKLDLMPTVHFARWMLINNGQRLLFLSNYDGSWSSYLADFSDQAWGVNLLWSNTEGFPPARFLVRAGACDLEGFEAQALTHFVPAPVFYSAYMEHSAQNILRYLEFRDDLADAI